MEVDSIRLDMLPMEEELQYLMLLWMLRFPTEEQEVEEEEAVKENQEEHRVEEQEIPSIVPLPMEPKPEGGFNDDDNNNRSFPIRATQSVFYSSIH